MIWEEPYDCSQPLTNSKETLIKRILQLEKELEEAKAIQVQAKVKPACEKDIRIDELNKLQQTLNPYQMNENDFFRAMMDGTIKNTILMRINELSKSV